MQPARLWVQEPIFRVLNSEHLYKRHLAELARENSSWGLSFQVSVLPAPPGSWVPRTVLSSCRPSSELWPALGQTEGEGHAKQRRARGWFSFQLPSSLAPPLCSLLYFKSSKSQRNNPQCGLFQTSCFIYTWGMEAPGSIKTVIIC